MPVKLALVADVELIAEPMIEEDKLVDTPEISDTASQTPPVADPVSPVEPPLDHLEQAPVMASPAADDPEGQNSLEMAALQDALAQLATENETLRSQLEERNNQFLRMNADFDNFRKRTQKEKEDLEQQVKRGTLGELLPVVDSFERARSHLKPQTDQEVAIHKSYQGVYKQLVDCLKRIGVSPMRPEGKPFDPNLHEAVLREPTVEHPEGTVIEELVRGYLLGERVLRHAMVKVAAEPESAVATGDSSGDATEA